MPEVIRARGTRHSRGTRLVGVASALLLTATLAACSSGGSADSGGGDEAGYYGSVISNPYVVPETPELQDTDGADYSLAGSTDKPLTIVFFGYTNCPDICKMVMANIASGMTRLDDDQRKQVDVAFVTTDPARDDGPTLRRYLDRYGDGMIGLTGPLDDLVTLGDAFHVYMKRERKLPSGGYDVSHTTHYFALNSDNEVPVTWSQDTAPADFANDVVKLLEEES